MKESRLNELYHRPLVVTTRGARELPLKKLLERHVEWIPEFKNNFDVLEIGAGDGEFVCEYAKNHPAEAILAIEIGNDRAKNIIALKNKGQLFNLTVAHGEARVVIYKNLRPQCLKKVFVFYPDPWPKNRHRHLRLLSQEFLIELAKKMESGARFYLVSDVKDYVEWVKAQVEFLKEFKLVAQNDTSSFIEVNTDFARRWQKKGRLRFAVEFLRVMG